MLQIGGYANYFNLGVQTAVGRYVAEALSLNQPERGASIVTAGVQFLMLLALFAAIGLVVITFFFGEIFQQIDSGLLPSAQTSLLWIGGAFILALPPSALSGAFIGVQRNEVAAFISVASRILIGLVTAWSAIATHDIALTSAAFFAASVAGYLGQYLIYRQQFPAWRLKLLTLDRPLTVDLSRYCLSLGVWSLSMLLVNGLSVTLVGILDFASLAYFGVAMSLITFLVGIQQSVFSPLIQIFAGNHVRSGLQANIPLLMHSSAVCSALLVVGAAFLLCLGRPLLTLWVGESYAVHAYPLLLILVAGNVLRYTATPYALWLIAVGQQQKVLITPFIEGLVNLAVSLAAGYYFGATGVAVGVVAGGLVGIVANLLFNIPRTLPPDFDRLQYVRFSLLGPVLAMLAAIAAYMAAGKMQLAVAWEISATLMPAILYMAYCLRNMLRIRHLIKV